MESRFGTKEEKQVKMLWNNFKVAFAMYSKIPMPRADWSKENMKYTFCFFPFIGLVIGALSLAVGWAGSRFGFQAAFVAAVLVLVPVWVTGGIHVDGLLDTSDALSSWQEKERRLEILKDSHAGAFAVITACVYFLAWYGAYSQLWLCKPALEIMALGFMVSRCFSGISVMTFPKARKDGTVAEFSRKAEDLAVRNVLIVYLVILLAVMVWIQPVLGILAFAAAGAIFLFYHHKAMKYRRNYRRLGRLFPLPLRGGNGSSAGGGFCADLEEIIYKSVSVEGEIPEWK